MELSFSWVNLLILFGALQALVFSIVLVFQRQVASKFLAGFVFILAYNGFETFNWSAGLNHPLFNVSAFVPIFAIGPMLYLYIRSSLQTKQKISGRAIVLHLLPFLFQVTTRLVAVGIHLLFVNGFLKNESTYLKWISFTWTMAEPVSMLLFVGYVTTSVRLFLMMTGSSFVTFFKTPLKTVTERWIHSLLIWSMVIGTAWALTLASAFFLDVGDSNYYPIELLLVGFNYWLVLVGYHKTKLIRAEKEEPIAVPSITSDEAGAYFSKLANALEVRKLYLDPKLNLARVSAETGIPAKVISNVLNQHRGSSFNDFINQYRIKEVCRMLADPEARDRFTISAIALECGFNSQATFQRVFKNTMGMPPRDYMSQMEEQPV